MTVDLRAARLPAGPVSRNLPLVPLKRGLHATSNEAQPSKFNRPQAESTDWGNLSDETHGEKRLKHDLPKAPGRL